MKHSPMGRKTPNKTKLMIYLGKNLLHELLVLKGILAKFPKYDNATKIFTCNFKVLYIKTYFVAPYILKILISTLS